MSKTRRKKSLSLALIPAMLVLTAIVVYAVNNELSQDTRSSASEPSGRIRLSPATVTGDVGAQFNVEITVDPDSANSGSAKAVDAILRYNKDKVRATQITAGSIAGTYPYTTSNGINNSNGTAKLSWVAYRGNAQTPPITSTQQLGTVTFEVIALGESNISLEFSSVDATVDSNIVRDNAGTAEDILGATSSIVVNDGEGEPEPPPDPDPVLLGDINEDGRVSLADYAIFLGDYINCRDNSSCNERSDLNDDTRVSLTDYSIFLREYKAYRAANPGG